ncbi:D-2-hydroxyglutarate dehydrogenase YdiJ [Kushneria marisflavi]|uniref:D-2-hydroxyglutarate dehydrogenase n=1 Tax=Kushneria marisflavi TaxID=157779 RepID=A0A240ULB5_9GAMM|nr:FAD-binding and (Fe-S)-binding domain-containing protein [Kushneria marisflavi]ART61905.1 FAD-binding oxidoreductase [Kushneria marisflavi]RKD86952.1 FAD/FMN-containing dehydrogenase [Kushneria marisflavi]
MTEQLKTPTLEQCYQHFLDTLDARGFKGDIAADDANRVVLATDNSIYQRLPQAVVYPRDGDDITLLAGLAGEPAFREVVLAPRGGGTGTNGQSLTDGLVVDVTRYMHHILDIDVDNRRVRVQAGVVKDQLNAALKPHGLFFAPELSTSNRATIGGMISTDACGQGSRAYGKTRHHVLELDVALLGGERFISQPLDDKSLEAQCARTDRIGDIYRCARDIIDTRKEQIEQVFPPLNRSLTGYDLAHLRTDSGLFDLNSVLCGSEGSLGFLIEATLNVLPLPKYSALINVRYSGFMDALRDARALMGSDDSEDAPTSIETIDDRVLMLAMEDIIWDGVAEYFPAGEEGSAPVRGINLVEFNDNDEAALERRIKRFTDALEKNRDVERLGHTIARGRERITTVYGMRKRAVGLLGNVRGEKRPIPFIEDTAVPPEQLADYIGEFRALLDGYGLEYGMFGHVDAGVLHVRPAIDMKDPEQAALIRPLSDEVVALTQRYGGLLWGEHGKGVRSEYTPAFFGELYPALQQLKGAFDPHNQLNPGKIATPPQTQASLLAVDGVTTRGELDRTIDERVWQSYHSAVYCNGNGACYNYDPNDAMCPSWKATRERIHSPKGRASLMREWLRREQSAGHDVLAEAQALRQASTLQRLKTLPARLGRTFSGSDRFSDEVHEAMAGCLACKSCAGQCPVRVNVPDFRSRFLELYHGRRVRPLRDHLIARMETLMPRLKPVAPLYNALLRQKPVQHVMARWIGMVDAPSFSHSDFHKQLHAWGISEATPVALGLLSEQQKARSVVLVQDAFTSWFDARVAREMIECLSLLGIRVFVAPYQPNGKPMHVQGFMGAFTRAAKRQAEHLRALARLDVPLVGLDPAMTLTYRQEYVDALGQEAVPEVMLPQEWLLSMAGSLAPSSLNAPDGRNTRYRLLSHCTEKTNAPGSARAWQQVFQAFGLELELVPTGCCGMSGTYGHEARNLETSRTIYSQSWQPLVETDQTSTRLLATGYSCRSQVKRFSSVTLEHPLQALLAHLRYQQASR